MTDTLQYIAFTGGTLQGRAPFVKGGEAVLALPPSRLLVRLVRVPAGSEAVAVATPLLQAMSPFPDQPLAVSCETVEARESETIVLAAALPEDAADDIAVALDEYKLNVVRVDVLPLGLLRGVWGELSGEGRRLVLMPTAECLTFIVLDGELPVALRGVARAGDLKREALLSLLEAEDFGGEKKLDEIVLVQVEGEDAPDVSALAVFAPVRTVTASAETALAGIAARAGEEATLNALPETWRTVLDETRFKRKLVRNLSVALGVWALALAVLFGVPAVYGFLTDRVKADCRAHQRAYKAVADKKAKTQLVQKYSDHARGALEIMKAVSDRLPGEGLTLTAWEYKRDEGLRLRGEADASGLVYTFKEDIVAMAAADDADAKVFPVVKLGALSSQKGGQQKFDLECKYSEEERE